MTLNTNASRNPASSDASFSPARHTMQAFVCALVALGSERNTRRFLRDRKGSVSERTTTYVGGPSSAPSLGSKVGVERPWEREARKAFAPLKGLIEAYHAAPVSEVHGIAKLGTACHMVHFRHEVKACALASGVQLQLDGATVYTGPVDGACQMMADMLNGARPAMR